MSSAAAKMITRPDAVPQHPRGALIGSVLFHVIIILLAIFGLPFLHHETPPETAPMSVDLVSPRQAANEIHPPTHVKAPPVPKPPTPQPPTPQPPPPQVTPAEPQTPTPPVKPQEPTPKTAPTPDELAPPKKAEVKPVKTPPKPKLQKQTKADTKQEQQQFDTLLKNLIPTQPTAAAAPDAPDKVDKPSAQADSAAALGPDDFDALKRQLTGCWNILAGAQNAENLMVVLRMYINQDRTLSNVEVVDQLRYNSDPYFRAAAESALRAVHDPRCHILDLPADKYNQWKVMEFTFDPSQTLQ